MNTAYEDVVKSNKNLAMLHYVSGVEAGEGKETDAGFVRVLQKAMRAGLNAEKFNALVNALLSIYLRDMITRAKENVPNVEGYLRVQDKTGGADLFDDFLNNATKSNVEQFANRIIGRVSWMKSQTAGDWHWWNNDKFKHSFWTCNLGKGGKYAPVRAVLWLYEMLLREKAKDAPLYDCHILKYDCHILKDALEKDSVNFDNLAETCQANGMQVEHIHPRNAKDNSYVILEDDDFSGAIDCFGNYCLITPCVNLATSNKPFGEKIDIYEANGFCGLLQVREICIDFNTFKDDKGNPTWGSEQIQDRQDKIVNMITEWDEALCPASWWQEHTKQGFAPSCGAHSALTTKKPVRK